MIALPPAASIAAESTSPASTSRWVSVRTSRLTGDQTLISKGDQPALHRPPAPQLVKDSSVAHDVVEMLEGE